MTISFDIGFYEVFRAIPPKNLYKNPYIYSKNIIQYKCFTEICLAQTHYLRIT